MKILVYDDNPDFGGHQIMACRGIEALAAEPSVEIICMLNPANRKLADRLSGFQTLERSADFQSLEPDLVLCIQGDIAQSVKGITAAKRAGIECVSYLALPHTRAVMGARLGPLRDLTHRRFINAPDRFITISDTMKQRLLERGCTRPVSVVPNGIETPVSFFPTPFSGTTVGLVGRIEFKQKQQDFMVRTFLQHPAFKGCRLPIVGSGPDETALRKMTAPHKNISALPWQEDMDALYEQIDCLAIPSRYEGVPLVMLEALARGIPVIGSARDGMKDTLPAEWTFPPGNPEELAAAFSNVRKMPSEYIENLKEQIIAKHSLESFRQNFCKAVLG